MKDKTELPPNPELEYVLDWFEDIYDSTGNGWSPTRVTFVEIKAYVDLTGERINPSEVYVLRQLSDAFLEIWDQRQKRSNLKSSGVKNLTPMSDSAGIKALFAGRERPKRPSKPPDKRPRPKPEPRSR